MGWKLKTSKHPKQHPLGDAFGRGGESASFSTTSKEQIREISRERERELKRPKCPKAIPFQDAHITSATTSIIVGGQGLNPNNNPTSRMVFPCLSKIDLLSKAKIATVYLLGFPGTTPKKKKTINGLLVRP